MRFGHLLPHVHSPHWLNALGQRLHTVESAFATEVRSIGHAASHTIGGLGSAIGGLERKAVNGVREVVHDIGAAEQATTHAIAGGARWVGHEAVGIGHAIGGAVDTVTGDVKSIWGTLEKVGHGLGAVLPFAVTGSAVVLPLVLAGGAIVMLRTGLSGQMAAGSVGRRALL